MIEDYNHRKSNEEKNQIRQDRKNDGVENRASRATGSVGEKCTKCANERQRQQPGKVNHRYRSDDGPCVFFVTRDHPRIGTKNLDQREKSHRQQQGQQAGQPKLLDAICHAVLLFSGDLNQPAQFPPIFDLRERASRGLLFRHPLPAQFFAAFFEMRSEFRNNFGPLCWLQGKSAKVLLNKRLPITHEPPSRAAARPGIVPTIPAGAAKVFSSPRE